MLFVISLFLSIAKADSIYDYYQDRSQSQWTISDWFSTKKQTQLMDQWLALNRSSKKSFDLQFGYTERNVEETTNGSTNIIEKDYEGLNTGIYFHFLGIEADYFQNKDNHDDLNYSYSLNLRLLGSSQQSTYWKIYYGNYHEETTGNEYEHIFYGSSLNLYITSYLGIQGDYRKFNEDKNAALTAREGYKSHYGVFLEVFFFRFYHYWQSETYDLIDISNTKTTIERDQKEFGLMLFY